MQASERVNRLMSTPVLSVVVDAPVKEALRLFAEYPVHHLPVVKNGSVVGMLSSADIMKLECFLPPAGAARDRLLGDKFHIATLMRTPVVAVSEHESVERAAEMMVSHAIHSLPVVNAQDHLIGIVTTTDIIAAVLRGFEPVTVKPDGEVHDHAAMPSSPQRLAALERVAHEARRYLNAGQDERLHAALMKAIDRLDRIDESHSGHHLPVRERAMS